MGDGVRVSVVQMNSGSDKAVNLAQAAQLVDAALAADRPDMVALPELWPCIGGDCAGMFAAAEALPQPGASGGPAYEFLRAVARDRGIHVHGGSLPEAGGEKLFNTTVVFNPEGVEVARYRKMHLFDRTTPDGGGFRESRNFGAGEAVVTFDAHGLRIGCAICYDLRFPELFLALRRAGAELIMLPSAFTMQTGKDHWEPLIRARAIETQCWLAAPALWGPHQERGQPRMSYGHSMLVDPWGHVVARVSDQPGWATATIDPALTARVRREMPVMEHRKLA